MIYYEQYLSSKNMINIERYVTSGVSDESIDLLCKELDIPRDEFDKFMFGQGCAYIPNKVLYYEGDVARFLHRYKKVI
jgi:hypothetical protein